MKHRAIMIIALFALVSLFTIPVSAYVEVSTWEQTDGTLGVMQAAGASFYLVNGTEFHNADGTKIESWYSNVRFIEAPLLLSGTILHKPILKTYPAHPVYLDITWDYTVGTIDLYDSSMHFTYTVNDSATDGLVGETMQMNICDTDTCIGATFLTLDDVGWHDNSGHIYIYSNATAPSRASTDAYTQAIMPDRYPNMRATTYSGFYGDTQPVASFTCVPTHQYPNTNVVCTDTSTNEPTDWLWAIDMEALGVMGWQTSTSQDFSWQAAYPGWYSVNLKVNNTGGFDWENKTNYVFISVNATPNNCALPIATGYSRTFFRCADTNTDASISGCDIQLNDIEGSLWSNVTDRADGIWCIDTLPLHNINAYGQATGYTDGSRIGVQEWNMMRYIIPMIPGYLPPPAVGYVWVYVHVTDFSGSVSLSGATVSLSGAGLSTVVKTTDSAGIAMLQWPNVTTAFINAAKPGYTTGMKVITTSSFGPDFVTIALHQGTYTSTITPTVPPGGITAPPTLDSRTTSEKDIAMMDKIRDAGPDLIDLAIVATIFGLIGLIGGSMRFGRR